MDPCIYINNSINNPTNHLPRDIVQGGKCVVSLHEHIYVRCLCYLNYYQLAISVRAFWLLNQFGACFIINNPSKRTVHRGTDQRDKEYLRSILTLLVKFMLVGFSFCSEFYKWTCYLHCIFISTLNGCFPMYTANCLLNENAIGESILFWPQ